MVSLRPTRSRSRRIARRDTFFPGAADYIWPQAKEEGWALLPRNIGLLLAIIDTLKEKGADPGRTYIDLLANNLGEGIVEVNREADFALRAGLSSGERGVRSWEERLEILAQLGFIKIQRGPTKRIDFIVLVHPRKVVKQLRRKGVLKDDALWNAFVQSLLDFDPKNANEDEPMGPNGGVLPSAIPPPNLVPQDAQAPDGTLEDRSIHAESSSTPGLTTQATDEKSGPLPLVQSPPITRRLRRKRRDSELIAEIGADDLATKGT
ncbi:hypothetical protein P2318_26555 [Myxococcaceae bacterium GXIMD 01537]